MLVVGARDAAGKTLGARARQVFRGRRIRVIPERFSAAVEPKVLQWLDQEV